MVRKIIVAVSLSLVVLGVNAANQFVIGKPLPHWKEGELDIYHIHEGAGNSTFMIFPDGTTLLYDLGDMVIKKQNATLPEESTVLPNNSKTPYQWVARFIKEFSPHPDVLNYVVISHYHFDHIGEWNPNRKTEPHANYKLIGVTGLADEIHIQTLIDRSYPDYEHHGDFPNPLSTYLHSKNEYGKLTALTMQNYQRFVEYQIKKNHLNVEKFKVGSDKQIHLIYHQYPNFKVQNIIGDGYVWTGKGDGTYHFFPHAENDLMGNAEPENDLSNGFRIDDGAFRYFTGGDMTGRELSGKDVSTSAEAVAAPVIGVVDVATMDHHGFDDAQSNIFVKTLRPLVWIQQNWAVSQTTYDMLLRTTDLHNYNYSRDLFAVQYFKLNDLSLPAFGKSGQHTIEHFYKNTNGHIVVRVMPGGKEFWVIMLTSDTDKPVIKAVYGPYHSMNKNSH